MKMRILCLAFFFAVLTGCNPPAPTPEPTTVQATERVDATATPTTRTIARVTVQATDTATPTPWLSVTPRWALIPTSTPTLTPTAYIIETAWLDSKVKGNYRLCSDPVLDMDFEYPSDWGFIETQLRPGLTSGYAYEYNFFDDDHQRIKGIHAGGRSSNFAEGRGAMITDFKGYIYPGLNPCEIFSPRVCYQIKPGIIFKLAAISGAEMCVPEPRPVTSPMAIVEIVLPENPKINGFIFAWNFLPEELTKEFDDILGLNPDRIFNNCTEESIRSYDQKLNELFEAIASNKTTGETRKNLNKMIHLAESIVVK
jgi:hypothetical protein